MVPQDRPLRAAAAPDFAALHPGYGRQSAATTCQIVGRVPLNCDLQLGRQSADLVADFHLQIVANPDLQRPPATGPQRLQHHVPPVQPALLMAAEHLLPAGFPPFPADHVPPLQ